MSAPTPAPSHPDTPPAPLWTLGEALLGALAAFFLSQVLGALILGAAGVEGDEVDDISLLLVAPLQATLWVGMIGAVWLLVVRRGGRPGPDLGLRFRPVDLVGLPLGVACQYVLVPVISAPWVLLLGKDLDELREPACRLADKADDPLGVALLFLITVIGAPVVEELFFRGFIQRAAVARLGRPLGVVVASCVFGLAHFQVLQLPALIAFGLVLGLLADRTGRLGPSILAHLAFNATTVINLVALSPSGCDSVLGLLR